MSESSPAIEPAPTGSAESTSQEPPVSSSPTPLSSFPDEQFARPALGELLIRPPAERAREYRYRFGQSVVFGLPVFALQLWGNRLGGREAARWAGVFQALLTGWVVYVTAAGMLFEGVLLLRRRVTADLVCAVVALAVFVFSSIRLLQILLGNSESRPAFHAVVLIMASWSGARWWQFSRRCSSAAEPR